MTIVTKTTNETATAEQKIQDARMRLLVGGSPASRFFACLVMRLIPKELEHGTMIVDPTGMSEPIWFTTMATDGRYLYWSRVFVDGLDDREVTATLCHEIMHCAHKHHIRRMGREPRRWNVAGDLAINSILNECGYKLPKVGVWPGKGDHEHLPDGKHSEYYYDQIEDPKPGESDPGGCGMVIDAGQIEGAGGDPADAAKIATEWDVAVRAAAISAKEAAQRGRGTIPAGLQLFIDELEKPKIHWFDALAAFVEKVRRDEYSWSRVSRRHLANELIMPGFESDDFGDIVAMFDTSASMDKKQRTEVASELFGLFQCGNVRLHIIYHDADVAKYELWTQSDGELEFNLAGGGGTDHRPVFDFVDNPMERAGEFPDAIELADADVRCVIAFSDLGTAYPDEAPEYPVLWVQTGDYDFDTSPPFGDHIKLSAVS